MKVDEFRLFSFNFTKKKQLGLRHYEDNVLDERSGIYFLRQYDVRIVLSAVTNKLIFYIDFRNPEKWPEMFEIEFYTFKECMNFFPNSNLKYFKEDIKNAEQKAIAERL